MVLSSTLQISGDLFSFPADSGPVREGCRQAVTEDADFPYTGLELGWDLALCLLRLRRTVPRCFETRLSEELLVSEELLSSSRHSNSNH